MSDSQLTTNTQTIHDIYMSKKNRGDKPKKTDQTCLYIFKIIFGLEKSVWSYMIIAAIATGLPFNQKWEQLHLCSYYLKNNNAII